MGYETTSTENINEAKEHIQKAYRLLLEAIDDNTSGSLELSDAYVLEIEEIILKLSHIKRKL